MDTFVRGAAVFFNVVFKDEDGDTVVPTAAKVRIAYYAAKVLTTIDIALIDAGSGNWNTAWDSSPADAGQVSWWAQSGDPPKSATQGTFTLHANAANPQA
jgi:hypothetical protein